MKKPDFLHSKNIGVGVVKNGRDQFGLRTLKLSAFQEGINGTN